ncbi:MAG: hypothetical protein Q8M29_17965 [Bacteroidota bacterium]|nr:hypothetical protein [Bacteroidota bacterium]
MKKQLTKKAAPKKAIKKAAPKKAVKKVVKKVIAKAVAKAPTKVDEKLMHQIDWLTADVVNGYFMGVDADILSKAEIKKLIETSHDHQEIFDHLSVDKNTSADFAEFLLFYMHTLVFEGAASTVLQEWKEDSAKVAAKKKKK